MHMRVQSMFVLSSILNESSLDLIGFFDRITPLGDITTNRSEQKCVLFVQINGAIEGDRFEIQHVDPCGESVTVWVVQCPSQALPSFVGQPALMMIPLTLTLNKYGIHKIEIKHADATLGSTLLSCVRMPSL